MMKIIEDPNNDHIYNVLSNIDKNSRAGIRKAFYFIGRDLRATTQELILDKNKTGRAYLIRLGRIRRSHQASAPGEAPANLTGALRKSIGFDVRGSEQLEFGSRDKEYAKYLEEGTDRMQPRPFLKPSIEKNQLNALQHFEREIQTELNK